MDVALFVCLIQLNRIAAWALVPYLLYRVYAVWWGFALWKLNKTRQQSLDLDTPARHPRIDPVTTINV